MDTQLNRQNELPIPEHFDPGKVGQVWRVPYPERALEARNWARQHKISPAAADKLRIALLIIDAQNTFCIPDFELFVGGRSGNGAVEDNTRLCEFIYRNLGRISKIIATLDTHLAVQIFHPIFLIDEQGEHPAPLTLVSYEDVVNGRWRFNPDVADSLGIEPERGQAHLLHYTRTLENRSKYKLTIWPYHAMLGGIGHALVSSVEEAVFFHSIARGVQADFEVKGSNPMTEHYSAIGPEVLRGEAGEKLDRLNTKFIDLLPDYDALVIAGQAKSHCVAWTVEDLLEQVHARDETLAKKVYLLEDCTSPVVVPGVLDYSDEADEAFRRFAQAGMHLVKSTLPIAEWPGMALSSDQVGRH